MLTITNVFRDFSHAFEMTICANLVIPTERSDEGSLTNAQKNLCTLYKTKKMPVVLFLPIWQKKNNWCRLLGLLDTSLRSV